jgi:RNA polymerase sigma factor (sigma-70 family)
MGYQSLAQLTVAALVALIATGQVHEPWEEIDRRYRARATGVAFAIVKRVWPERSDAAADIAQEALIQAYTHLNQYERRWPFWPWLKAIVRNKALDRLRREGWPRQEGKRSRVLGDSAGEVADPAGSAAEALIAREASLDARGRQRCARRRLRRALARLAPRDRELLLRFHRDGETVSRLARDYRIAEQTVRGALSRAKKTVLARLGGLRLTNRELSALLGGKKENPEAVPQRSRSSSQRAAAGLPSGSAGSSRRCASARRAP